jgi:acetone carboxylase gamma subunit
MPFWPASLVMMRGMNSSGPLQVDSPVLLERDTWKGDIPLPLEEVRFIVRQSSVRKGWKSCEPGRFIGAREESAGRCNAVGRFQTGTA